jgi:hypothetical protein
MRGGAPVPLPANGSGDETNRMACNPGLDFPSLLIVW